MKSHTRKTIVRIWNRIQAAEPDISTERLFARTAEDARRLMKICVDESIVAQALAESQQPAGS